MVDSSGKHTSSEEMDQLQAWKFLISDEGTALVEAASDSPAGDVAAMARLRKRWDLSSVTAAMELAEARRRAGSRFENAHELIADRAGLEQATGTTIARYKAKRIHDAGVTAITDLCCGIGGDSMELARSMGVVAIDLDPLKSWMTEQNAQCETRSADVLKTPLPQGPVHIDPARRDAAGTRRHAPSQWTPSATDLHSIMQHHPDACIKMGPGIDLQQLPIKAAGDEVEFISVDGQLSQAVLWKGLFVTESHRATCCVNGLVHTISSDELAPASFAETNWNGQWLHVPDPALERSQLLGLMCDRWSLAEPAAGLGLLVGSQHAQTPWLKAYEVVDKLPWRIERIKQWLHEHDAGIVEVRTRGGAIQDVDRLRSTFRGKGQTAWTIFGLRLGQARIAVLTRPPARRPAS